MPVIALLAVSLSQAGMVAHWLREPDPRRWSALILNAVGAAVTLLILLIVVATKFSEGAWITTVAVAVLLLVFRRNRAHANALKREVAIDSPLDTTPQPSRWSWSR